MDNKEIFKKEYMSIWQTSESYNQAFRLWVYYQYQCELYDRKTCAGNIRFDGIMPSNAWEYAKINQHAYHEMTYILGEAKRLEINDNDWNEAKRDVNRLTWEGIQKEYQRLYQKGETNI